MKLIRIIIQLQRIRWGLRLIRLSTRIALIGKRMIDAGSREP